jgi:two-component system, LytTR family, sensor kinase
VPQYWQEELAVASSTNVPNGPAACLTDKAGIDYPGPLLLSLVWTLVGTLAYARHYLQDPVSGRPGETLYELLNWLTCFLPWIGFSPLVFRLERRYPLLGGGWPWHLMVLAGAAGPIAYLVSMVAQGMSVLVALFFHRPVGVQLWWVPYWTELGVQLFMYGCTVLAGSVMRCSIQLNQREREAAKLALEKAELEGSLRQAELETLRMRLNPHFLFNTLQNIAVLTQEDPKTASQMLTRLGALLRTALRRESSAEMTLASEIALTKSYVAIEKMRFEDRLSVLFDIAPETEQVMVPAFLLQPLVENAILHGLRGVQRDGVIIIRSLMEGAHLIITITDNGIGLSVKDKANLEPGVGLTSTCERLEKMYPQQHSFSIRALSEGGTEVRVSLPVRYETAPVGVMAYEQAWAAGRR